MNENKKRFETTKLTISNNFGRKVSTKRKKVKAQAKVIQPESKNDMGVEPLKPELQTTQPTNVESLPLGNPAATTKSTTTNKKKAAVVEIPKAKRQTVASAPMNHDIMPFENIPSVTNLIVRVEAKARLLPQVLNCNIISLEIDTVVVQGKELVERIVIVDYNGGMRVQVNVEDNSCETKGALTLAECTDLVAKVLLYNNVVVGCGVHRKLLLLGINYPVHSIRDVCTFSGFKGKSLRHLAETMLSGYCITDKDSLIACTKRATAAMFLYRKFQKSWEVAAVNLRGNN